MGEEKKLLKSDAEVSECPQAISGEVRRSSPLEWRFARPIIASHSVIP